MQTCRGDDKSLDWRSWLTLVFFFVSVYFTCFPVKVPLSPLAGRFAGYYLPLDLCTVPLFTLLVLCIAEAVSWHTIPRGIGGENDVRPYAVLLFFFGLSYLALSLDQSGAIHWLSLLSVQKYIGHRVKRQGNPQTVSATSLHVAVSNQGEHPTDTRTVQPGNFDAATPGVVASANPVSGFILEGSDSAHVGSGVNLEVGNGEGWTNPPTRLPEQNGANASGARMFFLLMSLFFFIGIFLGNDPIVLSGTPFLVYFTQEATIADGIFWYIGEFIAANAASALLVVGNPTNLIMASALGVNFVQYTAWVFFPVMLSTVGAFAGLWLTLALIAHPFRGRLSNKPRSVNDVTADALLPRKIFSPVKDPNLAWTDKKGAYWSALLLAITLFGVLAVSFFTPEIEAVAVPACFIMLIRDVCHDIKVGHHPQKFEQRRIASFQGSRSPPQFDPSLIISGSESSPSVFVEKIGTEEVADTTPSWWRCVGRGKTAAVLKLMPWKLVPFALCVFVYAEGLGETGWISLLARGLAALTARAGCYATIFVVGLIGVLMCNIAGTNIGAAIILSGALKSPCMSVSESEPLLSEDRLAGTRTLQALGMVAAFASNVGAFSFAISSSLAGILMRKILAGKGQAQVFSSKRFLQYNALPILFAWVVGMSIFAIQAKILKIPNHIVP